MMLKVTLGLHVSILPNHLQALVFQNFVCIWNTRAWRWFSRIETCSPNI